MPTDESRASSLSNDGASSQYLKDLIVAPFWKEGYVKNLLEHFESAEELTLTRTDRSAWKVKFRNGREAVLVHTSPGCFNAGLLIDSIKDSRVERVYLTGFIGGAGDGEVGDLLIPYGFRASDGVSQQLAKGDAQDIRTREHYYLDYSSQEAVKKIADELGIEYKEGTVVTVDDLELQDQTKTNYHDMGFDAEGARIEAKLKKLKEESGKDIRLYAVLGISDKTEEGVLPPDTNELTEKEKEIIRKQYQIIEGLVAQYNS